MAMSKNINFEAINKLGNGYDRDDFGKKLNKPVRFGKLWANNFDKKLNKKLAAKHKQRDYYRSKMVKAE